MKKSVLFRTALIMLVLTMVSSCFVGSTFAKYVTSDSATDTARVAKWGVSIEAENNTLFTTDYKMDDTNATFQGEYSVSSATGDRDDVVAPGTKGSVTSIAISGTPEVAVDVVVDSTVTLSENWLVDVDGNKTFYCPIKVTVGSDSICGLDYDSASEFAKAIDDKIEGYSAQYAPNTDLSSITDETNFDIGWEWAFEDATGAKISQNDEYDTALGEAAVSADLTITFALDISVTQID